LDRPQVRPAQREVRSEIPGTRNEGATPKARPPLLVHFSRASIDVGQERTHLFEKFLLLRVRDWRRNRDRRCSR
jgi:hypothetical protein